MVFKNQIEEQFVVEIEQLLQHVDVKMENIPVKRP